MSEQDQSPLATEASDTAALEALEAQHGVQDQAESTPVHQEPSPRSRSENGQFTKSDTSDPQTPSQESTEPQGSKDSEPESKGDSEAGDYIEALRNLKWANIDHEKHNLSREQVIALSQDIALPKGKIAEKFDEYSQRLQTNGNGKGEPASDPEAATSGPVDLTEMAKNLSESLSEELGSEAGEKATAYFSALETAYRDGLNSQSGLISELLGETQRLRLGATHPVLLKDEKAWTEISDEAAIRFKAGLELGKYPEGSQGMRQAFDDAARLLMPKGTDSRDRSQSTPPTRRSKTSGEKMTRDQYDDRMLSAIEGRRTSEVHELNRIWDSENTYSPF